MFSAQPGIAAAAARNVQHMYNGAASCFTAAEMLRDTKGAPEMNGEIRRRMAGALCVTVRAVIVFSSDALDTGA